MANIVIESEKQLKFPYHHDKIILFLNKIMPDYAAGILGELAGAIVSSGGRYLDNGVEKKADVFILNMFDEPPYGDQEWTYYIDIVPAVYPEGANIYTYRDFSNLRLRDDGEVETSDQAYNLNPSMVNDLTKKIGTRVSWNFQPAIALDLEMLKELSKTLLPMQEVRSYLHLLNQQVGPDNMTQMLPPELIDYIADQLYPGRTRQYPPVLNIGS